MSTVCHFRFFYIEIFNSRDLICITKPKFVFVETSQSVLMISRFFCLKVAIVRHFDFQISEMAESNGSLPPVGINLTLPAG